MKRIVSGLLVTGLALLGVPGWVAPAAAVQAPVAFVSASSPTYQTNGIAFAVAESAGLVFVGGTFTSVRPPGSPAGSGEMPRANLVVLDAATGAPTRCAPSIGGTPVANNPISVRSLRPSADGRTLYIGGFFGKVNGSTVFNLAALDIATCSLVTSFVPAPNGTVRTILATPGAIFFGGDFASVASIGRTRAAAVSPVGAANPGAILPWTPTFDRSVRAIVSSPDGTALVVGGDFNFVNGAASHALVVVSATVGGNVMIFANGFIMAGSVVKDIAVDTTGFYTANEGTGGGVFDGRIAINWGTYAQRWRDTCLGATQAVVVYRSVLYSGSHAHDCSSMGEFPNGARHHLLAESVNQPRLVSWFPQTNDGLGEAVGPRDMVVAHTLAGSDYLFVVGEFTTVNGVSQTGITRFGQGADTTAPTAAITTVTSPGSGQARVAWRAGVDTDDATLTYMVYRDGSATPLQTVQGTSWFWQRPQLTVTDSGLLPGSRHAYRVDVTDGRNVVRGATQTVMVVAAGSSYASMISADGASLLWRYDDTCDVFVSDDTANGRGGTLQGSSTCGVVGAVKGDPSVARTLTGTSTTIYTETATPFANTDASTVETWIKTTTAQGGKIVGFGDNQSYPSSVTDKNLYMTSNGQLVFGVLNASTVTTVTSTATYNDGLWHQVVGSVGPSGLFLYVDGAAVAGNPAVTTSTAFAGGFWRVGGDTLSAAWPNKPVSSYWSGSVDETAVYGAALSATAIHSHYALATGNP